MRFARMSIAVLILLTSTAGAQTDCAAGTTRARGQVLDSTGAAIVSARVSITGNASLRTDAEGRFVTACLAKGTHNASVAAEGFEPAKMTLEPGSERPITVHLKLLTVETEVDVDAGAADSEDVAGSKHLGASDLKQMADDPDEFARQLQVLAAAAGGAPGQAIVTVDGFQNGGRIPPKSSIAFIRINPDLFSAEYQRPPYQGGRVEIYTKPGQAQVHGALFTTQSGAWINAKDPFATSRAAIGKQRYGFELSGPIRANRSDFAVALERRQIDQFAVVNAVTLDSAGNNVSTVGNVATPQALWEASARLGAMLTKKNNFTASYTAGVSNLQNLGVGGTALQESGYNSVQSEHVVRFTNLQTLSASAVHETRIGYTWRYRSDIPNSTAPSLQVAGAFTGGGAATQGLRTHERDLEIDDDILLTHGNHNVKAGVQLLNTSLHETLPIGFNGSYIFGGGAAPLLTGPGTTTISGLEQYRRTRLGLPGGTPTQYSVTSGTPQVALNQQQVVLFGQDQWKLRPRLSLLVGMRWALQNTPETVGNIGPRLGLAWSPDRKQHTVLHLRSGLFFSPIDPSTELTAQRLDGISQRQMQIYSPVYGQPLTTGSATITTLRAPLPALSQTPSLQSHLGVEHDFPGHWHAQANLYLVRAWDILRSRNINAPLDGSPTGARPLLANTNLLQFQQTGDLHGNVLFMSVDQRSLKRLQIFAGYIRMDLRGNADGDTFFPQSSLSDAGETARPAWMTTHHFITFSSVTLPRAVTLSMQFDAASGQPYNVTTGFDNNGDGVFNDRPFGGNPTPGTPVYNTRFGALSPTGTGATLGRNAGTLPWNVHLDANLSRSFNLPLKTGKEAQTLAVNLRSTNLLNHANITAVGGVLGSPLFGQGYAADPGRRIEAGLRWSF
jgi:hypothetical protein